MSRALLVRANGEVREIDIPENDGHIVIHHMVGGWFDLVRHKHLAVHAYVHDEGLLRSLRPNVAVSFLFNTLVVGDAVISATGAHGNEENLDPAFFMQKTLDNYNKMNTDEELVAQLEKVASEVDTTFSVTIQ
jgi:hypothetical protein